MSFHDLLLRAADRLAHPADDEERHRLGHELSRSAGDDPGGLRGFIGKIGLQARAHPGPVLDALRRLRPVLVVRGVAVATAFDGVSAVLANHQDFGVTYGPKMTRLTEGANFFLGQDDDCAAAGVQRALTSLLFRREDAAERIPSMVERLAAEALAPRAPRIDVVAEVFRLVPARFAIEHFGLRGVDPRALYEITEALFEYLFIDIENDPAIAGRAEAAGAALRSMLDVQIADRDRAGEDSVIARGQALAATGVLPVDPFMLRNNLLGLLIGLVPTTAKAAAMALDYLTLDAGRAAILRGALPDARRFAGVVREAMRLNPINPGLLRTARRDARVPCRGGYAEIPAGATVFAATISAMRDPAVVDHPLAIDPARPASVYLNNGLGLHACFGRYVNDSNVTILLRSVLEAEYQRKPGPEGDLFFEGPFPKRMILTATFGAGSDPTRS